MSSELLASIAGIVLSLVFSYIPGIKQWFENLSPAVKQAVMGGLLLVVAAAIFGLSCLGIEVGVSCSAEGALGLLRLLIAALVANQSVYLITKKHV